MTEASLRAYDCYQDPEGDNCFNLRDGNYTHAVLCIGNIKIPLCKNCVEQLTEDLNEFNNTIFCHKCLHFIPSEAGWGYGGSCKKWAKDDKGIELTSADAGYLYCKNNFDTCKDATSKEDVTKPEITVKEMNIFDQREIHHDCTVEVLSNSITGQVSIGWWPNDNPPATLTNEGEIIE